MMEKDELLAMLWDDGTVTRKGVEFYLYCFETVVFMNRVVE